MPHDEPDEPTQEELDQDDLEEAGGKPGVQIVGLTAKDIEAVIRGAVMSQCDARKIAQQTIEDAIATRVHELVDEHAKETIRQAVQEIFDNGWTETDQWGHEKKHFTLAQRISALLEATTSSYHDKGTNYQVWVKAGVEECFKEGVAKELAKAKVEIARQVSELTQAKLREMVGAMVDGKLADIIKGAIGVK